MQVTLIIAWLTVLPGQPVGPVQSIRTQLPHMEACHAVAGFIAAFIDKAPTKDGVKFALRCEPHAAPAQPQQEDKGI